MRPIWIAVSLGVFGSSAVLAGDGFYSPSADAVWPQWQARITLQGSRTPLLQTPSLLRPQAAAQGAAGSVLGDYYFAPQGLASGFRASGGLLLGGPGATPFGLAPGMPGATTGLALSLGRQSGIRLDASQGLIGRTDADAPFASPYLGLGYSGPIWHSGFSLTADLGLVAERVDAYGRSRGVFGTQSLEGAMRDLRFSPLLQVGVRYAF